MALCSESTGSSSAPRQRTSSITSSPAQTRVSLLAKARRLPAFRAARAGRRPTAPDMAATTVSASGRAAASSSPVMPAATRTGVSASRVFSSRAAASS